MLFSIVMASCDKRIDGKEHNTGMRWEKGGNEGSAGGGEESAHLNPDDLAKLRKVFIFPVKDVSLKLKKAWKVCFLHMHCITPSIAVWYVLGLLFCWLYSTPFNERACIRYGFCMYI